MLRHTINSFSGKYAFLSNFYGDAPTVEHQYQTAKTDDPYWKNLIMQAETPGKAKRLGRKAPLRPDWEQVKLDIMRELVRQKFSSKSMQLLLLETGEAELIEGNYWGDTFWGVCRGKGENWLGKILMETREQLK